MQIQNNYNEILTASIFDHCTQAHTGTVLITTNNNKSCQVTIEGGEIVGISMGRFKGYDVAHELLSVGIKRASFNANMQFPHTKEALIGSSERLLKLLGYNTEDMPISALTENTQQQQIAA